MAACLLWPAAASADSLGSHAAVRPAPGGLSLVPERWRYHPEPLAAALPKSGLSAHSPARRLQYREPLLEAEYVADRRSFVNTVRARRGLSLLTLWEGAGRCLFFGINERGRAGFNLVRMRVADRKPAVRNSEVADLYAELTGQVRATFPEPPDLFPH